MEEWRYQVTHCRFVCRMDGREIIKRKETWLSCSRDIYAYSALIFCHYESVIKLKKPFKMVHHLDLVKYIEESSVQTYFFYFWPSTKRQKKNWNCANIYRDLKSDDQIVQNSIDYYLVYLKVFRKCIKVTKIKIQIIIQQLRSNIKYLDDLTRTFIDLDFFQPFNLLWNFTGSERNSTNNLFFPVQCWKSYLK